jgi:hypothetical protein
MEVLQTKNIAENGEVKECKIENKSISDEIIQVGVLWFFGSRYPPYYIQRPEGRTDTILTYQEHTTGNLLITGGPAVNPVTDEFDTYFGISYVYQPNSHFQITSDGYTLQLNLSDYPHKDICIIHVGRQNNRNVLIIWGYGWQGTYAGTLFLVHPNFWDLYMDYHMFLLEWEDTNGDGLVQVGEISKRYAGYGPHIV